MSKYIIKLDSKVLTTHWWSQKWCNNIAEYADYYNRLQRGRTYLRQGTVSDLVIENGIITANVSGSAAEPYNVVIKIKPLSEEKTKDALQSLEDINNLKSGTISIEHNSLFSMEKNGLFPTIDEIEFSCSCPDWAALCKHAAAVLYAVGCVLDQEPLVLFQLRGIDVDAYLEASLVQKTNDLLLNVYNHNNERTIEESLIEDIFGIKITSSQEDKSHRDDTPIERKTSDIVRTIEIKADSSKKNDELAKVIRQFDLEGVFVKEYKTYEEAEKATGISRTGIKAACNGKQYTAGNFQWRVAFVSDPMKNIKKYAPLLDQMDLVYYEVLQIDSDGNIINKYNSYVDAGRITGISSNWIREALSGRQQEAGGYQWKLGEPRKSPLIEIYNPQEIIARVYTSLENQEDAREIIREAIVKLHSPEKEQFVYDLYKKNQLSQIGSEHRINGRFFTHRDLDFTNIAQPEELLGIMQIIGMESVVFHLVDFDKPILRRQFIALIKKCYDADWARELCARGMSERRFVEELNSCKDTISADFIKQLLGVLTYISSHDNRPRDGYTRFENKECIELLSSRLSPEEQSCDQNNEEVVSPGISATTIPLESPPRQQIVSDSHTLLQASVKSSSKTDTLSVSRRSNTNGVKKANAFKSQNHKQSSKTKQNELKKSQIITIVIIAVILLAIVISLISNGAKSSQNKYTDLTKDNSVYFTLNNDDTYTMKRNVGFLIAPTLPEVILIPETYDGKPVTAIEGFSTERKVTKIIGSKNLVTIEKHAFADTSWSKPMQLKEVVFPKDGNLKEIKYWAFFNCPNLKRVVVPENFESFGTGVFYHCTSLSVLMIYATEPPSGAADIFNDGYYQYYPPDNFAVYVPDEYVDVYKSTSWSRYRIYPISSLE